MVRATFAGFSTALSALQSNQKRLDIVGHNLSNMNTVGYTRQELQTSSINYTSPVSTFMNGSEVLVGFGVHMDKVAQIRDPYLDAQYRSQMDKSGFTDSIQTSLDSLAKIFDESSINGIHQAFVDIQTALNDMQDVAKVNDPIYESELRSKMKTLANMLNQASKDIDEAEAQEFNRLVGTTSTQNGAQEQVNDLLRQIGDLNHQIKRNQILGQQSLELMDERNNLLDTLASFLPIEVTYYKDQAHDGIKNDGSGDPDLSETYYLDKNGKPIAKKEWPDDVRVEMVYKDANGDEQRITLVEGSEGGKGENYGRIEFTSNPKDPANPNGPIDPNSVALKVIGSERNLVAGNASDVTFDRPDPTATDPGDRIYDGSIQASLHMLWQDGSVKDLEKDHTSVNGYEFYRNQLDTLAQAFAHVINEINIRGTSSSDDPTTKDSNQFLLVNKETDLYTPGAAIDTAITAANIGINTKWSNGSVHISMASKDPNKTVLDMIEAMNATYPSTNKNLATVAGITNVQLKDNSFADYMNYTSTFLANDSYHNSLSLKTNVTVLNGIQNSRDSVSGVSLDEEASNMMQFMSAYNAASRVMTALDQALDVLINSTGMVGR